MTDIVHKTGFDGIIEIRNNELKIRNSQDILELMANYEEKSLILYQENFDESFYNLSTQVAGDILQKIVNYQRRLAIIGDFSNIGSKSFKDFVYECNKRKQILFLSIAMDAVKVWES